MDKKTEMFVNPEYIEERIQYVKENCPYKDDRAQIWEMACIKVLKEISTAPIYDPFEIYAKKEELYGE